MQIRIDSPVYTLIFTSLVCLVCSLLVAGSNVLLKDRQEINKLLYLRKSVLQASGLVEPGQRLSKDEALRVFGEHVEPRLVDLKTGDYLSDGDALRYDQRLARGDEEQSRPAPPNPARVRRIPAIAKVYLVKDGGRYTDIVIPIEGLGLYGTLYGFLALEKDLTTIHGIAFYENRETPGLGGEVNSPRWRALWPGRKAYDESGAPRIEVVKGQVGPAADDPYRVDALSGATMTSNGVNHLLHFWLGEQGFGPFLARLRQRGGP